MHPDRHRSNLNGCKLRYMMKTPVPTVRHQTPFFSVVVPVYNRARQLRSAVQSVLAQSFQDFEVIVVDDGSTDSPYEVLSALSDPRIHFFGERHQGGNEARNTGIARSRGLFIAFLDSDDQFLPEHLAEMHRVLRGTEKTVAYSPVIVDRGGGTRFIKPARALVHGESVADYLMRDRGFIQTSGIVVPSEIARAVQYRPGLKFGQDTDFAIRLDLYGCKFVMTRSPSVIWLDHFDPRRVSSARKGGLMVDWLQEMRSLISRKAYLGYRGWHVAKGVARTQPFTALFYYLHALVSGCYRPKLALAVLLQIILPTHLYRRVADRIVHLSGRPI